MELILCGTNVAGDVEALARPRRTGDAVVELDADYFTTPAEERVTDASAR